MSLTKEQIAWLKDQPPVPGDDVGPITNIHLPNDKGFVEEAFGSVVRVGLERAAVYRLLSDGWKEEHYLWKDGETIREGRDT